MRTFEKKNEQYTGNSPTAACAGALIGENLDEAPQSKATALGPEPHLLRHLVHTPPRSKEQLQRPFRQRVAAEIRM